MKTEQQIQERIIKEKEFFHEFRFKPISQYYKYYEAKKELSKTIKLLEWVLEGQN